MPLPITIREEKQVTEMKCAVNNNFVTGSQLLFAQFYSFTSKQIEQFDHQHLFNSKIP